MLSNAGSAVYPASSAYLASGNGLYTTGNKYITSSGIAPASAGYVSSAYPTASYVSSAHGFGSGSKLITNSGLHAANGYAANGLYSSNSFHPSSNLYQHGGLYQQNGFYPSGYLSASAAASGLRYLLLLSYSKSYLKNKSNFNFITQDMLMVLFQLQQN